MASALTHAFAAVVLTRIVSAEKRDWRFWTLLAGSAVLPDADVIGFAVGIHYGDLLGHRGLSHSLLFAAAWSLTVVLWEYRQVTKASKAWWTLLGLFFMADLFKRLTKKLNRFFAMLLVTTGSVR